MAKQTKAQIRMDQIRAVRGLPPLRSLEQIDREDMMTRVAAARCYIDRACNNERSQRRAELSAFMSIFHPEVSHDKVHELIRAVAP